MHLYKYQFELLEKHAGCHTGSYSYHHDRIFVYADGSTYWMHKRVPIMKLIDNKVYLLRGCSKTALSRTVAIRKWAAQNGYTVIMVCEVD